MPKHDDDLTHYMKACSRLTAELAEARAEIACLKDEATYLEKDDKWENGMLLQIIETKHGDLGLEHAALHQAYDLSHQILASSWATTRIRNKEIGELTYKLHTANAKLAKVREWKYLHLHRPTINDMTDFEAILAEPEGGHNDA